MASARRISGSASPSRLVSCSNVARLLRRIATFGWSLPRLASSIASARRISGSASPSRLVSCSNWARLLRSVATFGWSLPRLASSMASARRISGSASPSRLVSRSNRARLLRAVATRGWSLPRLASPIASARRIQRFRAGVQRLGVEQHAELAHQPRGRLGDAGRVRMRRHRLRMRRQRIEPRPRCARRCGSPVNAASTHPSASVSRAVAAPAAASPRRVTSCTSRCTGEARAVRLPRHQRIGRQVVQRRRQVLGFRAGHRHVQQEARHRLGRQEGQALQQPPARRRELVHRALPGLRHRVVVAGDRLPRPADHPRPVAAPDLAILRQRQPLRPDRRRRDGQRQGELAQLLRQRLGLRRVVRRRPPARRARLQQQRGGGWQGQHVQVERLDALREAAQAAGQHHVAAADPAHQPVRRVQRRPGYRRCPGSGTSRDWRSASPAPPRPARLARSRLARAGAEGRPARPGWIAVFRPSRLPARAGQSSRRDAPRRIRRRRGFCPRRPCRPRRGSPRRRRPCESGWRAGGP